MIPKSLQVGFLKVNLYGVVIAIAVFIAWCLAIKRAYLYKIPRQKLESVTLLLPLILGILGGRLYHVVDKWSYYTLNPAQIIRVDHGGLGIWGALIGIFLGFYVFARVQQINFLNLLDLLSPSILLAQGIGRIGNFINQEGFGPPTELPWGIEINRTRVHPTFFYEMILDFIFAGLLIHLAPKFKRPGQVFGLYLISYGLIRFIVEFWRVDTWTVDQFHVAHLFALVSIVIGLILTFRVRLPINH